MGLTAGIGAGIKARKAGGNFWSGKLPRPKVKSVLDGINIPKRDLILPNLKPQGGDLIGLQKIKEFIADYWPTDHKVVTSKYNLRRLHPETGIIKPHTGVDMRSYFGESNRSIQDGVVSKVYIGRKGSRGNYIRIKHINGVESTYFHTKSNLNVGDFVRRGQVIGVSDGSGIINHLIYILLLKSTIHLLTQ